MCGPTAWRGAVPRPRAAAGPAMGGIASSSGSRRTVPEAQRLPQSSVKIHRWLREHLRGARGSDFAEAKKK